MKSIMFNDSEPPERDEETGTRSACFDYTAEFDTSIIEEEEEEENLVNDFDLNSPPSRPDYSIFTQLEILKLQEDEILTVSSVLSLTKATAIVLLLHHNWSVSKVHDSWFSDEVKVRNFVGLFQNPVFQSLPCSNSQSLIHCGICLEDCEIHVMDSVSCGHVFCRDCWKSYISISINDGLSCLLLKCPQPSCGAAVDCDMIDKFAKKEEKEKFGVFLLSSYVEENRKMKWCPAPGCEFVIQFCGGIEEGNYDVTCSCSNRFCWNCGQESHRPVDCDVVAKWYMKNQSELENTTWIMAHTKPCPKCNRPIEKNKGCNFMTCRPPCEGRFCWLCLGDISEHRISSCNKFVDKSAGTELEQRRKKARNDSLKYTHHYERWENNRRSRLKAVEDLKLVKTNKMERLTEIYGQPISVVSFLSETWLQIIESRRVLQWSYAYGYYLPEEEKGKRELFEYLQGQAELVLERLHLRVETELLQFLITGTSLESFYGFRTKLIELTKVTETHFINLVRALENGLEEVETKDGGGKRSKR